MNAMNVWCGCSKVVHDPLTGEVEGLSAYKGMEYEHSCTFSEYTSYSLLTRCTVLSRVQVCSFHRDVL